MKPVVACTVLVMLLSACSRPADPLPPPRPALVVTVGAATQSSPTLLVGEVRSRYESAVGFRIGGKIIERKVNVGDGVKKGQVLARLDATDAALGAQAARDEVSAAEAEYALAQAELERQRQLYARHFISVAALDVHETRLRSSQARLQQTRAQAVVAGNQPRYAALMADRDGVVTGIQAEPGQVVAAGEPIAHIAVPNTLEVEVAVPESRMNGITQGVPAEIRLWAVPEHAYAGEVREVAPAADSATRTFAVRVRVTRADETLRLGMTAGVRFAQKEPAGFLLPSTAVTQRTGRMTVWVVDAKGQVQPRAVETGEFREDGALVKSGLQTGERVVVNGLHALVPGLVVRPVESRQN